MTEGKLVRVSPDTMEKLADVREGFESPNDCINRLLSKRSCKNGVKEPDESGLDNQMENSEK